MVEANYNATKESSLLFTLPYDKGWSASLNGKTNKDSTEHSKGLWK